MISKEKIKFIKSLQLKKYRSEYGLFLVEGEKNIQELLQSQYEIELICINKNLKHFFSSCTVKEIFFLSGKEVSQISTYENNSYGIAIVKQKNNVFYGDKEDFIVIGDNIKDPGNLGTIIRICDWYGITNLVLSQESVDFYNPKVISSSMGSFSRVQIFYTDLENFFQGQEREVYGAFLEGTNIHSFHGNFQKQKALVIGSESHGISKNIERFITQKLTIPRIGQAESLNVGVATGIILDNFFRHI